MVRQEEVNSEVVRRVCRALHDKDVDGVMDELSDRAEWTIAGRPDRFQFGGTQDKAGSRATLEGFLGGFTQFEFIIESLTAQDDRVVVEASSTGTGPGEASYRNVYLILFRLVDGKVVQVREHFDQFEVVAYVEQLA